MKTLIINGSPREHGNTTVLLEELRRHLKGDIIELSAFRSDIAPCVDCRACWSTAKCAVEDEMKIKTAVGSVLSYDYFYYPDPDAKMEQIPLKGEISSPINMKPDCHFAARCPYATEECLASTPELKNRGGEHFVACHKF